MSNEIAKTARNDLESMADYLVKSKLFGLATKEQAVSLMLLAQAEGKHPAIAAREYHIVQGRPALSADAALARFQQAGGKVEWHDYTDSKVSATFSHPSGGSATIDWDMKRAASAGLGGKDMWRKFPRQMLRSRVISEGVRTVYPGVVIGVYTPEEVMDFEEPALRQMRDVTPPKADDATVKRLEAAKKFIANAADEVALNRIIQSENYKRLLADLDGTPLKDELVRVTAERLHALQPDVPEVPEWVADGVDNAATIEVRV